MVIAPSKHEQIWSIRRKIAGGICLLIIVGIGIVWLKLALPFRPVQQAMLDRSITCRMTTGSAPSVRVMILPNGRSRLEWPTGNYAIADAGKARCARGIDLASRAKWPTSRRPVRNGQIPNPGQQVAPRGNVSENRAQPAEIGSALGRGWAQKSQVKMLTRIRI
jgi:hypothetical protein